MMWICISGSLWEPIPPYAFVDLYGATRVFNWTCMDFDDIYKKETNPMILALT
jgi:hypothetical protein